MIVSIIINIYSFIVECDATRFCCENEWPFENGTSGCEGRCKSLHIVDDGRPDCDNGSDEEVTLAEGNHYRAAIIQDLNLKSKNRAAVVVVWWPKPLKLMAVDLYVVFMCLGDIGQRYF